MPKRGGFFGSFLKSAIGGIGKVVSGLFGGAKQTAVNVAHKAIDRAKQHAVTAIQTGDYRGQARKAFASTKSDALGDARAEIAKLKKDAKQAATNKIDQAHSRFRERLPAYAPRPRYGTTPVWPTRLLGGWVWQETLQKG